MKVACFSVAALDFFPQQNDYFAGGNSLNQAIRMKQLGLDTSFIGALGTDDNGDRIEELLRGVGVNLTHCHRIEGKTATNRIFNDEKGERFGVDDAWNGGVYETYLLSEEDWKYMADSDIWVTHANNPNFREALKRKPRHILLGVDFLHFKEYGLLEDSLDIITVAYFGGNPDMADDLARLAKGRKGIVVLTLGAEGSRAFVDDKVYQQTALSVEKVIDTTGCGDAFQAAFTYEYYKSRNVTASLLAGAELGRTATQTHGGVPWITQ